MTILAFDRSKTSPPQLSAANLHLAYGERKIVHDLSFAVPAHKFTVIVGANACGKSTLLRGLARLLAPSAGAAYLDGKSIHQMPTRDVAQKMGLLPQTPAAAGLPTRAPPGSCVPACTRARQATAVCRAAAPAGCTC